MNHFHGKTANPAIPKPERKERPVTEKLVEEEPKHPIVREVKPPTPHRKPHYNELYGSLGVKESWRYEVNNYAIGTLTTVAGSPVSVPITMAQVQNWRLSQWPGAISFFLVLRKFSIAPQTAVFATLGEIEVRFQDTGGYVLPLGVSVSSSMQASDQSTLLPTPLADPSNLQVGSLIVTLNAGATVGTYSYQLGFSGAFLVPALRPYELEIANVHSPHH